MRTTNHGTITKTTLSTLAVLAVLACLLPAWGALTSSVQVTVGHTHTGTAGMSTPVDTLGYTVNKTFSNGSGTTQVADLVYHSSRTLASGAAETLDLYGVLTDGFGATLNFARVKAITIENLSGSMTVTIGSSTTSAALPIFDPATATLAIPPYGVVTLVAPLGGWTVTDSTGDAIEVQASSGDTSSYKIHVVGASN